MKDIRQGEGHPGHITLDAKCAGARSAGNPHAACEEAGAGNGLTVWLVRHSQRKRGATDRPRLRGTAPALDPTGKAAIYCANRLITLPGMDEIYRRLTDVNRSGFSGDSNS